LGGLAFWQIRKFLQAWEELRGAAFGLERDAARSRLNQSSATLFLLLMMALAEFIMVYFLVPSFPGAAPIPSPTLDLLASATSVLPVETSLPGVEPALTPTPGLASGTSQGCVPGKVEITSPKEGEQVSGVVKILGTVNIDNFGFYKYEIARPGESIWLSLNAGQNPIIDGELGEWITDVLPPGEYMLRLLVTDNLGQALPACMIKIQVIAPTE
jgi:hypothetical protein